MTVKKTSRRTSGSPQRSRAPVRATPSATRRAPASPGVPRESLDAIVAFAELAKREHVRWYLFGAQAVAAYGVPRTTGDVDVTLDLEDRGLESLVAPLRRAGFVPTIADESFAIATRIYPVTHEPTGWNFDLVLAGPGLEQRFLATRSHGRSGVDPTGVDPAHCHSARGCYLVDDAPEMLAKLERSGGQVGGG